MSEVPLAVRWPCGCITSADSRPSEMTVKDKRNLADQIAKGAEVIREDADTLRGMPHFLVAKCPHNPKGWESGK